MYDSAPVQTPPPWHMWGGSATIDVTSVGPSTPAIPIGSTQLVQVNYKRPESWTFLASAQLLDVTPPAAVGGLVEVDFEVQLGVGRATIILPQFIVFQWVPNSEVGVRRYAAEAIAPLRFNGDTVPQTKITELTAQSIQVQAKSFYVQLPGPFTAKLEFGFHVAPRTHIRPEWFAHKFGGGELGGR